MKEKYEFFKAYYNETFRMRDRIRSELLELTKLNILFYGVFIYFFSKRKQTQFIIDFSASLNWYHVALLFALTTLILVTVLLTSGLLPVPTKYISSPDELAKHWEKLDKYCDTDGVDENTIDIIQEHMLSQYTESAVQNDKNNLLVSKFKEYASYLIYFALFWFYILFALSFLNLYLGVAIFALLAVIVCFISYQKRERLNDG